MTGIHLLVPALWLAADVDFDVGSGPQMPALSRCLGQARRLSARSFPTAARCLFSLFGIDLPADAMLPVAAATHWADFPDDPAESQRGYWLRIDPVHLRPDMGKLLLFDTHHFDISAAETRVLIGELNDHLQAEGLQIAVGASPSRWYLKLPHACRLETVPPARANGLHIDSWIARGEDAREWQRRITELQMLMHQSSVNQQREQRGAPAINSVWPWGGGELPAIPAQAWEAVISDDVLAQGLARAASVAVRACEPIAAVTRAADRARLLIPGDGMAAMARRDVPGWSGALAALDRQTIAPLRTAVRKGDIAGLHLYDPGGHLCLQRADFWRFWRSAPVIAPGR